MDEIAILANYGLAVFLTVYLVKWMTTKLNSKLDRLIESIERLNSNIERIELYCVRDQRC